MTIMCCMVYTAPRLQDCAPQVWYCELQPHSQVFSKIQNFLSAWEGGYVNNLTTLATMQYLYRMYLQSVSAAAT